MEGGGPDFVASGCIWARIGDGSVTGRYRHVDVERILERVKSSNGFDVMLKDLNGIKL